MYLIIDEVMFVHDVLVCHLCTVAGEHHAHHLIFHFDAKITERDTTMSNRFTVICNSFTEFLGKVEAASYLWQKHGIWERRHCFLWF